MPQENAVIIDHVQTSVEDPSSISYIYTHNREDPFTLAESSQNLFIIMIFHLLKSDQKHLEMR